MFRSPNVKLYLHLLSAIATRQPSLLLPSVSSIKQHADYISLLSVDVSRCLIAALSPLLTLRTDMRDHFFLVLRKVRERATEKWRVLHR